MVVSLLMLLSDAFKVQMTQQGGVNSVQTGMCIGDFWTSKRNTIAKSERHEDKKMLFIKEKVSCETKDD